MVGDKQEKMLSWAAALLRALQTSWTTWRGPPDVQLPRTPNNGDDGHSCPLAATHDRTQAGGPKTVDSNETLAGAHRWRTRGRWIVPQAVGVRAAVADNCILLVGPQTACCAAVVGCQPAC